MPGLPYKLQLTKGYLIDLGQIARILGFSEGNRHLKRIPSEAFMDGLGLSDAKRENLCSMATAFGLINRGTNTPTALGSQLHRHDPFLDDLGTLWLLHYVVASADRYVIWNRLVNQVIPKHSRFSTAIARPHFDDLDEHFSSHSMDGHVRKELGQVWRLYSEEAFQQLNFIRQESEQIYVKGTMAPVPTLIFLAAILLYRNRNQRDAVVLDIKDLSSAINSPGRVFNLSDREVRDFLHEAQELGYIFVETRADLDQIRFRTDHTFLDVVREYYEAR